jgi:ABC-type amino acid transport substrate-binding protein
MAGSIPTASGRIFISYRREETAYPAGWLYDRLANHYGSGQVFKDVDSIELGDDFVEIITGAVGSCDVLLALIGDEWPTITDEHGRRRLDNSDDFVRLEIEAALTRGVRVIPILVDGARMPRADELPDSLARLVRRQALELSPNRFDFDTSRLLRVLDKTLAEVRTEQFDAAVSGRPETKSPDPSAPEVQEIPERRKQEPSNRTPTIPAQPSLPQTAATPSWAQLPSGPTKAPQRQRRPSTRVRVLAGSGVGVVLILVTVGLVLRPQPTVTIPDPGHRPMADAVALLRQAGFAVGITREANQEVATGQIIRMSPLAGTQVRRGAQLTLFVSSGPKVVPLPPGTSELTVGFVGHFATATDNPNGTLKGFEPILFDDPKSGQLQGLDVDLANALGRKLHVKFSFTPVEHFTHSVLDVMEKRVNIGMSVLRDDENGRAKVDYLDYLDPGSALLIPRDNPDGIRSLEDLCGKTVVRPLEMPVGSIIDQSQQCETNSKPAIALMTCPKIGGFQPDADKPVRLRECPAGSDPLQLVIEQQASAAVLDLPVARRLMETSSAKQQLMIAKPQVKAAAPYGIAIPKHDSKTRTSLQSALQAIIADGTYDQILAKWSLQAFALRTAAVNSGP